MKLQKVFVFLVVFITCFAVCFGQNQTESKLVEYFGKMSNDELQTRVMFFQDMLIKNNSHGYIVLYGENQYPLSTYLNERRIIGCMKLMRYSTDNLSFIFTNDKPEVGVQFWESPSGSQKPQFNEIPHNYELAGLVKPYLIYRFNEYIADEFCPLSFDMEFYSRFLKANPDIIGKIVIYEKTANKFHKEKLKYFRELTRKEKVSPKQINIVRGKYERFSDVEFWLFPAK